MKYTSLNPLLCIFIAYISIESTSRVSITTSLRQQYAYILNLLPYHSLNNTHIKQDNKAIKQKKSKNASGGTRTHACEHTTT